MADWSIYTKNDVLRDRSWKTTDKEISQNIDHYVDAFIKTFEERKNFAKMDFSPESLKVIDRLIKTTWGGGSPSEEGMQNCILLFGGYVGRVLENNFEGRWRHDGSESVYMVLDDDKTVAFAFQPFTWAMKRLVEGESLAEKYMIVSAMAAPYVATK